MLCGVNIYACVHMPEFFSSNAILHSNYIPFNFTVYHVNKKLAVIASEKSVWAKYSMDLNFQLHKSKAVPSHSALSKDLGHAPKAETEVKLQQALNMSHESWKMV